MVKNGCFGAGRGLVLVGFFFQVLAEEMPGGSLEIEVRNRVGEGQLNEGCGAEWAQKVSKCVHAPGVSIY